MKIENEDEKLFSFFFDFWFFKRLSLETILKTG